MQLSAKNKIYLSFRRQVRNLITIVILCFSSTLISQNSISELLKKHNSESIPYISVQELAMPKTDAILLDSREINEFKTSHLKGAVYVGYDEFQIDSITNKITDKTSKIVVYCSLGIRSENIAEQLKKTGYTNVYNLFGGIFEWKNNNFKIYNDVGETENVHAFSKEWSKWLLKGIKIYD